MALSDSRKRANAKWNKANTKNAACTLTLEEHAAFKAYAEQHGKTISGMLLDYVRGCISATEQNAAPGTPITRDEITSLMSIHGKDEIIGAVSKIDKDKAADYLMMVLILMDKQRELEQKESTKQNALET